MCLHTTNSLTKAPLKNTLAILRCDLLHLRQITDSMTLLYIVHVWIQNSWVVAHVYTAFLVTCDKQSHLLIKPCQMQVLHFAPDTPQCQGETVDHLHTLLFAHGRFMAKKIEKSRQSCRSSHIPSPAGPVPHFFFNTMEGIISTLCSSPHGRAQAPWFSVNLQ